MESGQKRTPPGMVEVRNIGGIHQTTVELSPGTTILVGRNATNRTSLLQAVMAALGSETVALKSDAEEGSVELTIGDDTYTRELYDRADGIGTGGDPYLTDPTLADLFAFLLESNEARRAVATSADLRELIMRPVDTEAIQAEIDQLLEKRESLEAELEELDDLKGKLPGLEEKRTRLRAQIDEKKQTLEAKEAELAAADGDVHQTREDKSELESKLAQLRSRRERLDEIRYDLETEQETIAQLKQEKGELERELADHTETPVGEIDEIDAEIDRLRERKQSRQADLNDLRSVIAFNEEMIEDVDSAPLDGSAEMADSDVTAQLLPESEVTCWTCGSDVEKAQIESTIDELRERSKRTLATVNDLSDEISELTERKRTLQQSRQERERIERRVSEIETEIERSENEVERLRTKRDDVTAEIERIEDAVAELENEEYGAILDLHKEANQLEYELGSLESDLERVTAEIEEIEQRLDEQDAIERELADHNAEIQDLRTRIDRIEATAVEEFNEQMDTVLGMLEYANLDRIWIERVEREVREDRRKVQKSLFELHVVRTTESGTAYEDTVAHLSESEREVTGLVFALAGYLAHEVYETVPFMLLDSLEAIDSERIATLVEYFDSFAEYLLVALLPEDAAAVSDEYDRITDI